MPASKVIFMLQNAAIEAETTLLRTDDAGVMGGPNKASSSKNHLNYQDNLCQRTMNNYN